MPPRLAVLIGGFLPAPENHHDVAGLIELDDHIRTFINRPDVVILVDPHGVRFRPCIETLADLADELAFRTELEQLRRGGTVDRPRCSIRARKDIDVSLGVYGD